MADKPVPVSHARTVRRKSRAKAMVQISNIFYYNYVRLGRESFRENEDGRRPDKEIHKRVSQPI